MSGELDQELLRHDVPHSHAVRPAEIERHFARSEHPPVWTEGRASVGVLDVLNGSLQAERLQIPEQEIAATNGSHAVGTRHERHRTYPIAMTKRQQAFPQVRFQVPAHNRAVAVTGNERTPIWRKREGLDAAVSDPERDTEAPVA